MMWKRPSSPLVLSVLSQENLFAPEIKPVFDNFDHSR